MASDSFWEFMPFLASRSGPAQAARVSPVNDTGLPGQVPGLPKPGIGCRLGLFDSSFHGLARADDDGKPNSQRVCMAASQSTRQGADSFERRGQVLSHPAQGSEKSTYVKMCIYIYTVRNYVENMYTYIATVLALGFDSDLSFLRV